MKNKKRYVFIILTLVFTMGSTVIAEPLNNQVGVSSSSLADVKDKRQELESKIEHFDAQIEDTMRKVEKNKKDISDIQNAIEKTKSDLKDNEEDIKQKEELFNKRMKAIYINGSEEYLDLLFNAKGLSDFISKAIALKEIVHYDNKISDELKEDKRKLQAQKDDLEKREEAVSKLYKENDNELALLKDNKNQQLVLLTQVKDQEKELTAREKETQVKVAEFINNDNTSSATSAQVINNGSNSSNSDVIAYASKFLGTPYLWGGTTPAGFDCSGFTQYVYAHFGVSLGRTTYDQINDGPSVSKSQLKPGDLVFFGTLNNPHHMGIYIGNNYYIHAPRTGDVIKISSMSRTDFVKGVSVR